MKALIMCGYGGPEVLSVGQVAKPKVKPGQVLVKVLYSAMNAGDWHLMRADPFLVRLMFGLFKPKIKVLGTDVYGVVEEVGPTCTTFAVGDAVFGDLSNVGFGGYAEYVCASESTFCLAEKSIDGQQYAGVSGAGLTAYDAVYEYAKVRKSDRVLITGASGGVGSFAVQMCKSLGAHVTAVSSTQKKDMVSSLGADIIIDYKTQDVFALDETFDVVIDCAAFRDARAYDALLKAGGRYVLVGGSTGQLFRVMLFGRFWSKEKTFTNFLVKVTPEKLQVLSDLLTSGEIKTVIDRVVPLAEVAQYMDYLQSGKAKGKIIVDLSA